MANPTLDTCRRRMNNLVFDPKSVPDALVLLQLTLYALPGARDRYERRMRGIKDRAALERFDVTSKISQVAAPSLVIWDDRMFVAVWKRPSERPNYYPTGNGCSTKTVGTCLI